MKDTPASSRAYVLSEIAGAQAKAGDLAGARVSMARADADAERAEKEPPPKGQDRVRMLDAMRLAQVRGMAPFATAAAKAGDVDGARKMLARARIAADRRATHVEGLCFEQSKAGEERDALAWADGLPDPLLRAHALLGVARGIIEHNKRLDAK
jgi:hypothetical protein